MEDKNQALAGPKKLSVERWVGRREAFGMIAGRCSAADAECLRQIRNQKLYLEVAPNWDEFCRVHLKGSRKKFDTAIRQLDQHGPQFFPATQMMRLTEAEYVTLKDHFTEEGLRHKGEIIAWLPENSERIAEAAGELRAIGAPKTAKKSSFETLVERFQALNHQLDKMPVVLEDRQRKALGVVLVQR